MTDSFRPYLPVYRITDGQNTLVHQVLPRLATLQCGRERPVPLAPIAAPNEEGPMADAVQRANAAISAIASRQLPLGGATARTGAGTVANELGRLESPLALLCRVAKTQQQR